MKRREDYRERRKMRVKALENAIEFCKINGLKPTINELFKIADKMLNYICYEDTYYDRNPTTLNYRP